MAAERGNRNGFMNEVQAQGGALQDAPADHAADILGLELHRQRSLFS
jgi:hypothetical protein